MFDFGTISFVKKEIEKQSKKESISHLIELIFCMLSNVLSRANFNVKTVRIKPNNFPSMLCLFCLPFFGNDILWRGHHWVLFEESQTLSRFMHVYKTANTCNSANTDNNEVRKNFRLKHKFMQPSCFMHSEPPGILSCHRYPVGSLLSFH